MNLEYLYLTIQMKIVVSGYREFCDEKIIERELLNIVGDNSDITLLHGGCRGVDNISGDIAKKHGWKVVVFPADWKTFGLAGGPIRNQKMLDEKPDIALLFLSKNSRGTLDMLNRCNKSRIKVKIVSI